MCLAVNITACSFVSNACPFCAGALQTRGSAHLLISDTLFLNNTSLQTQLSNTFGYGGAMGIYYNSTGEVEGNKSAAAPVQDQGPTLQSTAQICHV